MGLREMLELSKMHGLVGGSRAPLGLLLICLYLPGLFARSTGAPAEKVSPQSGQPSFTSLSNSGQPQPKPDPVHNESPRTLPRLSESPQDGPLPEGGFEMQNWGPFPMESWLLEDPQQGMEFAAADPLEQALPEALLYLSSDTPLPETSSVLARQPSPEASGPLDSEPRVLSGSSPLGTQEEAFAQRPFLSLIHRLLPGLPWGILNPTVSWGSGGAGTGWGTRPMPDRPGKWGTNGQVSGTRLGANSRYPGGRWGANGRYPGYPVGSWGANGRYPGYPVGSWGANGRYPGYPVGSWGANGRYPGYPVGSWGANGRYPGYPGGSWGAIGRYPVGSWGAIGRYPIGSWGAIGRYPGYPGGSWGANGRYPGYPGYPGGSWGVNGRNRPRPGARSPVSSGNLPNLPNLALQ